MTRANTRRWLVGGLLSVALLGTPAPSAAVTTAIEPGVADRSSLDLEATYDVAARLGFGTRNLSVDTTLTVTNTSGAPIDRLELNTVAARLGKLGGLEVSVDGTPATATRTDQTIVVQLGGVLPVGATAQEAFRRRW